MSDIATATPRQEFIHGARDTFPLIVGAIPFGIIFGTLAEPSGLSAWAALAMSALVFAGSSQFIALGLLAAGAALPVIIATTFIVNLRHMLYAATLVPHIRCLSHPWRAVLAFGLTDESFAVVNKRYKQSNNHDNAHWYFLGSVVAMYSNWQVCTALGITLGELFPDMTHWGLDFAMSVAFIAIVMPMLKTRPYWAATIVSACIAVASYSLPHKLGLMLAALCGVLTGMAIQALIRTRESNNGQ